MLNIRYGSLVAFHYFPPLSVWSGACKGLWGCLGKQMCCVCFIPVCADEYELAASLTNRRRKKSREEKCISFVEGQLVELLRVRPASSQHKVWCASPLMKPSAISLTCHPLLGLHLLNALPVESSGSDSGDGRWPSGPTVSFFSFFFSCVLQKWKCK